MTYNTITNSEQLREELSKTRERGYAMDNEEIEIGLSCVAVPVFSANNTVACTISVSSMTQRIQIAIKGGVIEDLQRVAADISREVFNYEAAPVHAQD